MMLKYRSGGSSQVGAMNLTVIPMVTNTCTSSLESLRVTGDAFRPATTFFARQASYTAAAARLGQKCSLCSSSTAARNPELKTPLASTQIQLDNRNQPRHSHLTPKTPANLPPSLPIHWPNPNTLPFSAIARRW